VITLPESCAPTSTTKCYYYEKPSTVPVASRYLCIEKEKAKKQYDKRTHIAKFRVGDQVLLYNETVRRGRAKKLETLWIGPYVIIKKLSDVIYVVKKGRRTMQVHANRIKHYIEN